MQGQENYGKSDDAKAGMDELLRMLFGDEGDAPAVVRGAGGFKNFRGSERDGGGEEHRNYFFTGAPAETLDRR